MSQVARRSDCPETLDEARQIINQLEERVQKGEQQLHALRLVCGITDANKFETALDRAIARGNDALNQLASEIALRKELQAALRGAIHRLHTFLNDRSSCEVCYAEDVLAEAEAARLRASAS